VKSLPVYMPAVNRAWRLVGCVVTVAIVAVDPGWFQQSKLFIMPQGFYGYSGFPCKISDLDEHPVNPYMFAEGLQYDQYTI
jgi:hypothetical protein